MVLGWSMGGVLRLYTSKPAGSKIHSKCEIGVGYEGGEGGVVLQLSCSLSAYLAWLPLVHNACRLLEVLMLAQVRG